MSESAVTIQNGFGLKQMRPGHHFPHSIFPTLQMRSCALLDTCRLTWQQELTWGPRKCFLCHYSPTSWSRCTGHLVAIVHCCPNGCRYSGSPGIHPESGRAVVDSTLLASGLSPNSIMQAADWASAHTLFTSYAYILHAEAVVRATPATIQDALAA